jgi:hypothetical protein
VQLPYGIHLIGVHLRQARGSHRTYIPQTCALDRRATLTGHTLTGHVSHGRSDFGANGQVDTNYPYCPPQGQQNFVTGVLLVLIRLLYYRVSDGGGAG